MKKALIFWGGWSGHQPDLVANRFAGMLREEGVEVEVVDNQDRLADPEYLSTLDLIVPCWTMGTIERQYSKNVCSSVASGVGIAGCHGGMCDAFRNDTEWQFMTGGQWVSHPGGDGVEYTVNIRRGSSPIVDGIEDFTVVSEHYYLHIDPSIEVLATTRFPLVNYRHASNKPVDMPVAWTKYWGDGRVFYCSLGHHDDVFDKSPAAAVLMKRGLIWAVEGKEHARALGLDPSRFENSAKMY